MAQRILATLPTDAISDGSQVAFSIHSKHFRRNMRPVLSFEGIAGAETVSLWKFVNGDWEEVDDGSGTQVAFTATYASDVINGPGIYGLTKDLTAGAVTVTLDDGV